MRFTRLVERSLTFYWRTNVAVVAGVAAAVTVLSGALLVGDSVRGSLRDLVLGRLGRTDQVIASSDFFRERLADDLRADAGFAGFDGVCPLITVQGFATDQATGRRASRVAVYGVDDRFWRFHGVGDGRGPGSRDVLLSPALARDLGVSVGGTVLIRVERPSAIPIESLHGRKEDVGRTLRLTVQAVVAPADLGEFSVQPQQADVRAAFVSLRRLQQDLDRRDRVNALLVSTNRGASEGGVQALETLVRRRAEGEDVGLTLRALVPQQVLSVESDGGLVSETRAAAARAAAEELGMPAWPVLTYLATSFQSGSRHVPYSLVTALDLSTIAPGIESKPSGLPPIVLNDWAARDLAAKVGDPLTLEYEVWEDPGRLMTRTAAFQIAGIVPIAGAAADRDLAPVYPGITDSENLRDWDPPFPLDVGRIRPIDEDYWREHRTTPKAFIPLAVGQALWRSRYGALTSIRIAPGPGTSVADAHDLYAQRLREKLDPLAMGLSVHDVRADALAASRGATDFAEYFTYFSFFLVVSSLLLAALFFKLGVEQRGREVGLLRALGFTTALVSRFLVAEAVVLAVLGGGIGVLGAVGYGHLMMAGLRTWWFDAVGTTALTLHVTSTSLIVGAASGVIAAVTCIRWTLRSLARFSERSLLSGQLTVDPSMAPGRHAPPSVPLVGAIVSGALGVLLLAGPLTGFVDRTGAFFGAGSLLLVSCLCWLTFRLRRPSRALLGGHGWWAVARLGFRSAAYRPGRSVLSVAVIASATFILISVDAFRRDDRAAPADRHSGTGGYLLQVDSMLPIVHDPNSRDGRQLLGLSGIEGATVVPFRVRPGDDTSCLNLYEPRHPRILAASAGFLAADRFAFQGSLGQTDEERGNPWLLLQRDEPDGAIPVVADANSMTYVLHRKLGDEIVVALGDRPLRLRLVAALADSIFQGELVMSEVNFLRLFPEQEGYRFLLVDAPRDREGAVITALEDRLRDFGADAVPTADRLAEFHKVENTYLSTFQTLGGLGLLLGTIGLATVLLRNVLERRRELALLGALGYSRAHVFVIVIAENALLLVWGLVSGAVCALVAIAPAAADRGGRLPTSAGGWLLMFAVLATGLAASVVATRVAVQARLLDALRGE
jgi:ABC-type lipoprotein release transport system permease subunit